MHSVQQPEYQRLYTDADLDVLGFHDCYVFGVRWDARNYAILVELDYIVQWVKPDEEHTAYRFWVAGAELKFKNVDDVKLHLDWSGQSPICQIEDLHKRESRSTPNGRIQWRWKLDISAPEGGLSLWATDIELTIEDNAVLSERQWRRG